MGTGWFDAFRDDGGPTWYGENRTGVVVDTELVAIVLVFFVIYGAFLIVFPGIRKEKWSSFAAVTANLLVGAVVLVSIHYPAWQEGHINIVTSYRAFSEESLEAVLGVKIGLTHVNVTLRGHPVGRGGVNFLDSNERFDFPEVRSMSDELKKGLSRGLPYPVLTVLQYFSVDQGGFTWGRQYRLAGYYTVILLWLAFAVWLLVVLLMCLVPQYYGSSLFGLGCVLHLAWITYLAAAPRQLTVPFSAPSPPQLRILQFHFSTCFWLIFTSGCLCVGVSLALLALHRCKLYRFATFLQLEELADNGSSIGVVGTRTIVTVDEFVADGDIELSAQLSSQHSSSLHDDTLVATTRKSRSAAVEHKRSRSQDFSATRKARGSASGLV